MNILQKLLITSISILQKIGLSNKTYSLWNPLTPVEIKRKGHNLNNPTDNQVESVELQVLRKSRVEQWKIENNPYPSKWPKRPIDVIDTIVVGATDVASWNSNQLCKFDESNKNSVTPGKPLPGISYHLFINSSGLVEKVAEYSNLISHTKGINTRSIGVVLQYSFTNNNAPPVQKTMEGLLRILSILCLEFKLNPYKAIKAQREVERFSWLNPWLKGHKDNLKASPGLLIDMDNLRRNVALLVKRKLKYAEGTKGSITPKFDKNTIEALNRYNSTAVRHLYRSL